MKRTATLTSALAASALLALSACSAPGTPPASPSTPATTPPAATPTATTPAASAPAAPTAAPRSIATASAAPPRTPGHTPRPSPTSAAGLVFGADLPGSTDRGFGQVRPSAIDFGNHATTIIEDIAWASWGDAEAVGTGRAAYVAEGDSTAGATQETARVRLWQPGTCAGEPAFTRITWTFPDKPPGKVATFDACSGTSI